LPFQHQQQTAAHDIAQSSVGLLPPQDFAQLPRQFPTAAVGVRRDELSQKIDLLAVDALPAVAPRFRHSHSMPELKAERKTFV